MEFSLHRALKQHYAPNASAMEVSVDKYRIDAVRRGGELVEVQFASLASLRKKVADLLAAGHRVCVVKPIVARKLIVRQDCADGPVVSKRWSPRRGTALDLFQELVYFAKIFPHPQLAIDAPLVEIEEKRIRATGRRRRFRRDYRIGDVDLLSIGETIRLRSAEDLLSLVSLPGLTETFTTQQLSECNGCSRWFAQRIAYTLQHSGAIDRAERTRKGWHYRLVKFPSGVKGAHKTGRRIKNSA